MPCDLRWPFVLALVAARCVAGESFRVATYNVENYLDEATQTRHAKSLEGKGKVRETIVGLRPDVLALQEMGNLTALHELRASLKTNGLDFPFWEHITGYDTNVHLVLLSRFPFKALRPHTNETFLLGGRRYRVSRGFLEAEIAVSPTYSFTLITAHLKSKRPIPRADEAELRLEEAKLLRERIDSLFAQNESLNLIVLGDLNDNKDAPPMREIIGRGKHKLVDTRPAEPNPEDKGQTARNITWTHFYSVEDTYSRLDYILLSSGMAREWKIQETYILKVPDWGLASDHRPLLATFEAEDK